MVPGPEPSRYADSFTQFEKKRVVTTDRSGQEVRSTNGFDGPKAKQTGSIQSAHCWRVPVWQTNLPSSHDPLLPDLDGDQWRRADHAAPSPQIHRPRCPAE